MSENFQPDERRTHGAASLIQLVQTGARPLWLISQRVARAGAGNGRRLRELTTEIREGVGNSQIWEIFKYRLAGAGWADLYERSVHGRWLRRTPPQTYLIVSGFPQLTLKIIDSILSTGDLL